MHVEEGSVWKSSYTVSYTKESNTEKRSPETTVIELSDSIIDFLEDQNWITDKRGYAWIIPTWILERIGDTNLFVVHENVKLLPDDVKSFALETLKILLEDSKQN